MSLSIEDLIDAREVEALGRRFGNFPRSHHRLLTAPEMRREWYDRLAERRGEIVLVLERPDGEVLVHTKRDYPPGTYRLLSGGIRWNEPVVEAFAREIGEETGLTVHGERLVGMVTYEFAGEGARATPFVSYVFRVPGVQGTPVPADDSEGIVDFRWVSEPALRRLTGALEALDDDIPGRRDWGRFRAIAQRFVGQLMQGGPA